MRMFRRRRLVKKGLTSGVKRVSGERHPFVVYLQHGVVPRVITGVLVVAALTVAISKARDLGLPHVGQKARQDIIATRSFSYPDEAKRLEERDKARAEVPPIYRLDEAKVNETFEALHKFFVRAAEALHDSARAAAGDAAGGSDDEAAGDERRQHLQEEAASLLPWLSESERDALLADPRSVEHLETLHQTVLSLAPVRTFTDPSYRPQAPDVQCVRRREFTKRLTEAVDKAFSAGVVTADTRAALEKTATGTVALMEDVAITRAFRDARARAVPQQYTIVPRGRTLIREGDTVTGLHRGQLQAYFKELEAAVTRETRLSYRGLVALVVVLFVGMTALYLWRFEPKVIQYNSKLLLIGLLSAGAVALTVGMGWINTTSDWLRYPVLVALPVIVVAMALPVRLAFFITVVLAMLSGIRYHAVLMRMTIDPTFVLLGLVGGTAAALYARTIRYRREFVRTGAMIGLLHLFVIIVTGLLAGATDYNVLLRQGAGGLVAGVLATTLAWVLLPAIETVFHVTTNVSLIELGDSNHPLLKRMVMEAPGTYHHSLVVGNLAEAAAESIGANPLLARVGALYHDIGKIKKPDYFSENEQQARSRHDTLIPSMSSLIITSHVKDGIDLGYKYRLTPAILDIIREHHGTSLVYYFYRRAEQQNGRSSDVDEADYRYPGPKPQSKEAAIIMLADAVEAAARAMEKPTASKIKTLIRELIIARFNDGQLDESELTLRDLHRIQESFTHIILGTLHQRVKYPKEGEPAEEEQVEEEAETPEPTGVTNPVD